MIQLSDADKKNLEAFALILSTSAVILNLIVLYVWIQER